jgi:hypothetical protein
MAENAFFLEFVCPPECSPYPDSLQAIQQAASFFIFHA